MAGKTHYPRRKYPEESSEMPGPGAFYGIACTGGRWDLAAPSANFQECRLSARYPVWWGRSKDAQRSSSSAANLELLLLAEYLVSIATSDDHLGHNSLLHGP